MNRTTSGAIQEPMSMTTIPPYIVLSYVICAKPHKDQWYPIGYIEGFSGTVAPEGFLIADGSAICKHSYPELFDVIGYKYTPTKLETPSKWWESCLRWFGFKIPVKYRVNEDWDMDMFCVPDCSPYNIVCEGISL
jgi:hypothetical protein